MNQVVNQVVEVVAKVVLLEHLGMIGSSFLGFGFLAIGRGNHS